MSDGVWWIELLGELRATRGAWVVSRFRTQKTAALLAYLAYFRDRGHPRELLVEMFWPDGTPEAGRNNLSQALSSLRHQLEPPDVPPGSVILGTRATIQLNPRTTATDVADLRAILERVEREPKGERRALLETALDLHRGELLPAFYQDWIAPERERLRGACVRAARALSTDRERAGDLPGAIDAARRSIALDPLGEDAHRELARLLAAAGDPSAARRHLDDLERTFERELGHGLSAATRELARAIERAAASPKAAPGASAGRPGRAASPERPAGVVTVLLADDPAAKALVTRHGGTPSERAGETRGAFARPSDALACALAIERASPCRIALDTGERDVAARASRLLAAGRRGQILCSEETAVLLRRDLEADVSLSDLGVFKLAASAAPERIFAAHRRDEAPGSPSAERVYASNLPLEMSPFHGRQDEIARLESELAPGRRGLVTLSGPGGIGKTRLALEVASRLLEAFHGEVWFAPLADVARARLVPEAIAQALRLPRIPGDPLDRVVERLGRGSALLVLDNFEQLVAEGAPIVKALLERASGLSCLVTSRQRLGLEGEREVALAPLPTPGPETPEGMAALASVQIFVDRARAVRPDFELTPGNAKGIAELVRRLEGIPLALALAAGRAHVLSPEQILARLADRLDLLVSRNKDVPERHRTLRAAIEGSTRLLTPELQRLLARLSVFRGGFTLDAVEAVCEEPLAVDALAELRECSLIACSGEELRFSMLETLREWAAEQLSPAEREAALGRHASFFAALAERAVPHLTGPGQRAWLDRLEAEQGNFRAAIEEGPSGEHAQRIAGALRHHWVVRGPIAEGRRLLAVALERGGEGTSARAAALMGAGALAYTLADIEAARVAWEEALALSRRLGDRSSLARALNNLGIVANTKGDLAVARARFEESAALARELDDRPFGARAVLNLANLTKNLGDFPRTRELLAESASLSASAGDRLNEAKATRMLGDLCTEVGDYEAAARNVSAALAIFEELGAREDVALSLHSLARIDSRQGRSGPERERLERAVSILRECGARANLPILLLALALHAGDPVRANALLGEGLEVARENGNRLASAHILKARGDLARRDGVPGARAFYLEGLSLLREIGARAHAVDPLEAVAMLDAAEGQNERAVHLLAAARALRDALGAATPAADGEREVVLAAARSALGASFDEAWKSGAALSWERAIELASGGQIFRPSP